MMGPHQPGGPRAPKHVKTALPPKLQQLALYFPATYLVTTLLNNDRLLVVTVYEVYLLVYGPFTLLFQV